MVKYYFIHKQKTQIYILTLIIIKIYNRITSYYIVLYCIVINKNKNYFIIQKYLFVIYCNKSYYDKLLFYLLLSQKN